jgi:hypothetical protein
MTYQCNCPACVEAAQDKERERSGSARASVEKAAIERVKDLEWSNGVLSLENLNLRAQLVAHGIIPVVIKLDRTLPGGAASLARRRLDHEHGVCTPSDCGWCIQNELEQK